MPVRIKPGPPEGQGIMETKGVRNEVYTITVPEGTIVTITYEDSKS